MKKIINTIALMAITLGFNANAGLVNLDINDGNINIAESITVTINAQNFDPTDGFFFDFNFDNSLLSYDASSLTSDLFIFDNQDPWYGLEVNTQSYGLSFDFLTDFFTPVEGDFLLASFELTGLAMGTTALEISDFFSYGAFSDYDITYSQYSEVSVNSATSVNEPATAMLFLLAGLGFASSRRKVKDQ